MKTLESPLDSKEIIPVNPKGNQSWIFIGRTDAEAEAPILWPLDAKTWLIGKDPDAGKDWSGEEKGMTEDEKVGWHYWLNGHDFEQVLGVGDGQGSLVWCSPWDHRVRHGWAIELSCTEHGLVGPSILLCHPPYSLFSPYPTRALPSYSYYIPQDGWKGYCFPF